MNYTSDGIIRQRQGTFTTGLVDMLECVARKAGRNDLVVVEVGSYQGESAEILSRTGKVRTVWCVDPWIGGYDDKDAASHTDMAVVEREFDKRLHDNPQMCKFKGTLRQFVESDEFKRIQGRVDLVYIDACHTYEGCKDDIDAAIEHIDPKVAYAGHDYANWCPGVKRAVDESFGGADATFSDSSWVKFRQA